MLDSIILQTLSIIFTKALKSVFYLHFTEEVPNQNLSSLKTHFLSPAMVSYY